MPKLNRRLGQALAEQSSGIDKSKLEKSLEVELRHLVAQGYSPKVATRICTVKVREILFRISTSLRSRLSRELLNLHDGFEADQLKRQEQVKRKEQTYSSIPERFECYQSVTEEEFDEEEEEEEEEQDFFEVLTGFENKYFLPYEEPEEEDQACFDVPDGFENDQLMAMGKFEEQACFDVPEGFENEQLMAMGKFEEQACFDVPEGFENEQLMAMGKFEEGKAFFDTPDGFENAQLIPERGPEIEKQSFDAGSSQHWGSIDYIPHKRAISVVLGHVEPHGNVDPKDCKVSTSRGTFNKVFIITLPGGTKYVLRVPRFGIPVSWNSDEETAFITTVKTMEYVRTATNLPIPRVLAYDHTHDNAIKHPYSIISHFPGRNVYWVWGDATNPNLEATRQRILRSLARTVSVLSKFSFDSHGSLQFKEDDLQSPTIGPEKRVTYHTCDPDVGVIHQTRMRKPYDSYRVYLERKYEKAVELGVSTIASVPNCVKRGELKILRMLLDCFPAGPAHLDADGRERFSIVPPDFDWQNILVDEDGNVTGLIDWDDMRTQHGLKGWASCPRFLRTDWIYVGLPTWEEDINMSPQDLLRYRRNYANYIAEAANGEGDACFTMKSAVWQAIELALKQSWDRTAILSKILAAVQPEIQDQQDFLHDVGRIGLCLEDEVELQSRFHAYLACSPGADTQHDV